LSKQEAYLENKISKLFFELEQSQYKIFHHQLAEQECDVKNPPPDWLIEESEQLKFSHDSMINSLHNQIICYLDMKNLHRYLDIFIKKFGEVPDIDQAYMGIDFEPFSGGIYNEYLHALWSYLTPFDFFKNDLNIKSVGVQYLENILKNTASILHSVKKKPKSEAEVYNTVRIVLESIFPSSKNAGSNFLKTAKEFKPDILIPELGAAIEYKFAKDEHKLKATIEQIAADTKGYTGDLEFNIFYAVFYVTEDFWGMPKFNQVWEDNEFPKNWRAFYIVGNSL
jgi:hypothetical protein